MKLDRKFNRLFHKRLKGIYTTTVTRRQATQLDIQNKDGKKEPLKLWYNAIKRCFEAIDIAK